MSKRTEQTEVRIYNAMMTLGADQWHTRAELSATWGRTRFNDSETGAIDRMIADGRIEYRTQSSTNNNPLLSRWEYRIKEAVVSVEPSGA